MYYHNILSWIYTGMKVNINSQLTFPWRWTWGSFLLLQVQTKIVGEVGVETDLITGLLYWKNSDGKCSLLTQENMKYHSDKSNILVCRLMSCLTSRTSSVRSEGLTFSVTFFPLIRYTSKSTCSSVYSFEAWEREWRKRERQERERWWGERG